MKRKISKMSNRAVGADGPVGGEAVQVRVSQAHPSVREEMASVRKEETHDQHRGPTGRGVGRVKREIC